MKRAFQRCVNQLNERRKIDPKYRTISRLQDEDQDPFFAWLDSDCMSWSDYEAMMAGKDPYETEAESRLDGVETLGSRDVEPAARESEDADPDQA
jgi:hypothetical protein